MPKITIDLPTEVLKKLKEESEFLQNDPERKPWEGYSISWILAMDRLDWPSMEPEHIENREFLKGSDMYEEINKES